MPGLKCTVAYAAKELGVSTDTIYRWVRAGMKPVYRTSKGTTWVDLEACKAWRAWKTFKDRKRSLKRASKAAAGDSLALLVEENRDVLFAAYKRYGGR